MLEKRSNEKEELDNLNLRGKTLNKTLDGLSLINRLLGNTNATFRAVLPFLNQSEHSLTIIDLGCGGGDNLRRLAAYCIKRKIRARFIGIEGNQNTIDYALTKNTQQTLVEYVQADILSDEFELPNCDVLLSSHFVYHFTDDGLINFLSDAKNKVRKSIIFSELKRSELAYWLFSLTSFFMPFSKIVKRDGKQAIRRAFTKTELNTIIKKAEIKTYTLEEKWAFRFVVSIKTRT